MPSAMAFGGGTFGKWLVLEGRAHMNRIKVLITMAGKKDFLSPGVKTQPSNTEGMGSISSGGTKVPRAMGAVKNFKT